MAKSTTKNASVNTHIYYYGGSGGFFVLHLLLLSGSYKCIFNLGFDFNDTFKFQWHSRKWSLDNIKNWKVLEYQVNSFATLQSDIEHKLCLWPNPTSDKFSLPGYKIVVYADIWTHFRMSYEKRCFWFDLYSNPPEYGQTITDITGSYDSEKNYDKQMQDYSLCSNFLDTQSIIWNDNKIYHKLKSEIDIDKADLAVTVWDIIKTDGDCLYNPLGLSITEDTKNFIRDYVELHPNEIRGLLYE